jgi:Bacterial SH3 domain
MKTITSLFVLFFAVVLPLAAINNYKAGDQLTVLAKSGLTLRSAAESKAKKKSNLPYGTVVTVLKEGYKTVKHSSTEFKGYTINGYWVKVKAGDEEGWVFDGYLSKLNVDASTDEAKGVSADRDLFDALYNQTSPRKGDRKYNSKAVGEDYEQAYEDGTTLHVSYYEGGFSRVINFKKSVSQEEAYLWGVATWWSGNEKPESVKYNASTKHLRAEGGNRAMRIMPSGDHWQASFELAD